MTDDTREQEIRQIVQDALNEFGRPALEFFLQSMMQDKRMLNQMADAAFMLGRSKIMKFPPVVLDRLKGLSGFPRMTEFILTIAPMFLAEVPIEELESRLADAKPFFERALDVMNHEN